MLNDNVNMSFEGWVLFGALAITIAYLWSRLPPKKRNVKREEP